MNKKILITEAVWQERERILLLLDELERQSHETRTPLFQETMFEKVRQIVQNKI